MKNMGVARLRLVRPVEYDPYRLEGIAHGTNDLIERIEGFDTFDDAVADCVRVVGFTARRRSAKWRFIDPRTSAHELLESAPDGPVAMVFGREDSGLPNDILDRMHAAVVIPTTEHASLTWRKPHCLASTSCISQRATPHAGSRRQRSSRHRRR